MLGGMRYVHPDQNFLDRYGYLKHVRDDKLITFVWLGGDHIDVYWSDHQAIFGDEASPLTDFPVNAPGCPQVAPGNWKPACDAWLAEHAGEIPHHLQRLLQAGQ